MMRVRYLLETSDGEVYAIGDDADMKEAVAKFSKKKMLRRVWGDVSAFIDDLNSVEEKKRRLEDALMYPVRFLSKLNRNGRYADGFPRFSINIPRKVFDEGYIDPATEWEVIITTPGFLEEYMTKDE